MRFKLFIAGCVIAGVFSDVSEAVDPREYTDNASKPCLYPVNKNSRRKSKVIFSRSQEQLFRGGSNEATEETIAAEQLLNLCRGEIARQGTSLHHEGEEVTKARCLFLSSVRNVLIWRQSRNHTRAQAMALGMNIERCRRELQFLEHQVKESEKNIERAKREAVSSFLLLRKAQRKAKL